jgi:hypothetical protein
MLCIANKSRSNFSPPKDQIADLLTKPLATQRFHHTRFNLNARELPLRLRGRVSNVHGNLHLEDYQKDKKIAEDYTITNP